jgi:hypothetical protein
VGSLHNELRRAGQLQRAALIALGVSDPDAGIERLGETLTPVIDLWSRPEWLGLLGIYRWAGRRASAALAANLSHVGVTNPTASNSIVVVEYAAVDAAATIRHFLEIRPAKTEDLAGNVFILDGRRPISVAVPRIFDRQQGTSGENAIEDLTVLGNTHGRFQAPPVLLMPGQQLVVSGATTNIAVVAMFGGTVRVALPGELE